MKKPAIIVGSIIAIILVSAISYFTGKEFVYKFSEIEIQKKMEENLPVTNTYLFIIEVSLMNPRIDLEEGSDRVNAGLDVELNITINENAKPLGGSIDASGGVRYVDETGAFFLTDPIIENLHVQGITQKYIEKVNSALTSALADYYSKHPIYTLSTLDAKQATVKLVLKNVVIKNQELLVTLGI